MADLLHVQPTGRTGQVLLWERHGAHPEGECWIVADDRVYVVGHTAAIAALLTSGALVLAPEPDTQSAPDAPPAAETDAPSAPDAPTPKAKKGA